MSHGNTEKCTKLKIDNIQRYTLPKRLSQPVESRTLNKFKQTQISGVSLINDAYFQAQHKQAHTAANVKTLILDNGTRSGFLHGLLGSAELLLPESKHITFNVRGAGHSEAFTLLLIGQVRGISNFEARDRRRKQQSQRVQNGSRRRANRR